MAASSVTAGVLLLLCSGLSYAQRAQTASEQEQWILGEYWTVVRQYEAGKTATAIKEMANWPQDRIAKVQATQFQTEVQLNDLLASKTEWKPATQRAAAMLHTEVGLAALQRRDLSTYQFHAGVADGWLNLADARKAVVGGLRSRWNVTVARVLLLNGEFALADSYLERINGKIANDPAIMVALGTAKESRAAAMTAADLAMLPVAKRERDALQATAVTLFERALAIDPAQLEAHLRLARLALDRADDPTAEKELGIVRQESKSPAYMYLVNLWLGGVRERAKDWNAAAELYVEAVKTQPDGQSAYVALAQVLGAAGQPEQARGVMERWFSRGVTSAVADPWWTYRLGLDTKLEVRFDAIFAEVRAGKDSK